MFFRPILFVVTLFIFTGIVAQPVPAPGAQLNHTQIMFEYEKIAGAQQYVLQIAIDTTGSTFSQPVVEQKDSSTATLISGLQFGTGYKWQYSAVAKDTKPIWKGPYTFTIAGDSLLRANFFQLKVLQNDTINHAGGLIFVDCMRSAFDRNGNCVLKLALSTAEQRTEAGIRNLQLTPSGTLTFLNEGGSTSAALETNLEGTVLWQTPKTTEVKEHYHHDFKKLPNGNYMVLSKEFVWKKISAALDSIINTTQIEKETKAGVTWAKMEYGTILEYDSTGKIVWQWKSANYLADEDIFALIPTFDPVFSVKNSANGQLAPEKKGKINSPLNMHAHLNAFSVDAANQFVYAGFRNLSRLVKIEKSTGKIVASWGAKFPSGEATDGHDFFSQQHDANIFADGTIGVYNNNASPNSYSSAIIIKQATPGNASQVVWKYECNFNSATAPKTSKGGSIDELPNHNYLVCTGNGNRIFETTRTQKPVWNALVASGSGTTTRIGSTLPLYRAHYASSLYPCYFTVETNTAATAKSTTPKNNGTFTLKVVNEGTEADSYNVSVVSATSNFKQAIEIPVIAVGGHASVSIKPDSALVTGSKLLVSVTSVTNPAFVRQLTVAL